MIGGVGLQIIRDWVLHFNERGPDGLLNGKSPGQPSKLNDVQRQAIAGIIEQPADSGSPRRGALAADRSGTMDLRGVRIAIAKQTLSRELRAIGYRKLSRSAARAQVRPATSAPLPPTSSVPSARNRVRVQPGSCRPATPRR